MVRATLRGLQFVWDKNNQEAVTNILLKQWKVNDRKMAAEMIRAKSVECSTKTPTSNPSRCKS